MRFLALNLKTGRRLPLLPELSSRYKLPRERFSRVPGMLNSSEVKVLYPT